MKLLKSAASLGGEILGIDLNQKLNQEQIKFLNQCWDCLLYTSPSPRD